MFQSALPALGLLLLMMAAAFALQRWKRHLPGIGHTGGPTLRVMHSVALGPQQRLVTVQVGEGADALCLVLGVAPGSVSTVHSLPMPPETRTTAPTGAPGATAAGAFASRLAQLMNPSAKGPHAPH
ncbi:MAG: flagellar biosynthetic protein FliO [Hydrogenophaga sp.]|jgi:flagellar protein FliO/FliZ|nr:flagellar biosynthetic protein FliO [Hydrogenophaga sp.]